MLESRSASGQFEIGVPQLAEVAQALSARVEEGLAEDGHEIAALPTFISVGEGGAPVAGQSALVLDLGGTNLRAARVNVVGGGEMVVAAGPLELTLPIRRGVAFPLEQFLGLQARALEEVAEGQTHLPLGYCFSYPARSTAQGDATLIRWTKGVTIAGLEGRPVGRSLLDAMGEALARPERVAVVNDTVAALFASLSGPATDGHVGLIVGTGNNMATFFPAGRIGKLQASELGGSDLIPVNLESGNFSPPHLSPFDAQLDQLSENPGYQRFEKAVSGAYLGRLLALAHPEMEMDTERGAQLLVELAASGTRGVAGETANAILRRSARLVAASICGLLLCRFGTGCEFSARILAEGSLFWKAPGYKEEVERVLATLPSQLGLRCTVQVAASPNANIMGTALAALSARRH